MWFIDTKIPVLCYNSKVSSTYNNKQEKNKQTIKIKHMKNIYKQQFNGINENWMNIN